MTALPPARRPAKKVDMLGQRRTVFHRACGGELRLNEDGKNPRYECTNCWSDKRLAGFWKTATIARMSEQDIADRFDVLVVETIYDASFLL